MVALYIGNKNYSSWSLRPWVLMTTLGLPFEERLLRFGTPEFRSVDAVSPTGLVPCLVDGDIAVWESLAIVEYLAEAHAEVWPADRAARAWARSAAAEMHAGFSALRTQCTMTVGQRITLHGSTPALERDIARLSQVWTDGLSRFGGPFLAGSSFTAVDAFFAPVAFRAQTYGLSFGQQADSYVALILALPAMKQWYRDAIEEDFREQAHEDEVPPIGVVTADFRAQPTSA